MGAFDKELTEYRGNYYLGEFAISVTVFVMIL
jgi:hypothetical protein